MCGSPIFQLLCRSRVCDNDVASVAVLLLSDVKTMVRKVCLTREGKPRAEYEFREDAEESAAWTFMKHGLQLVPYRCDNCRNWHLTPAERNTPSKFCKKCGKEGYDDEFSALIRADLIFKERRVKLKTYRCPHGTRWHLTSKLSDSKPKSPTKSTSATSAKTKPKSKKKNKTKSNAKPT